MNTRPSKHTTFLAMAINLSLQATCVRRQVGCILIDVNNRIIGSGYNGTASRLPHCIDQPCKGADCKSGEGLDLCKSIHAEQNALMQCSDVTKISIAYVTTAPCIHCTKMLLNTGCKTIIFNKAYANGGGKEHWLNANRSWIMI